MALAAGGTAYAQETGVETVTVTAQRVEQNLQQVPVAVSAFTSEQLRVNSINRIADVAQRTPNFTTTAYNQAEPEYYIRGIGTSVGVAGNAGGDPSVILMLDGAYLARGGANLDLYDLERIEVLRGPQGTLFGKNALGGVMQIVTRKPTDEFFYEFSGTYGNYNRTDGRRNSRRSARRAGRPLSG
jgi:iron complex outermembrane receptor protein